MAKISITRALATLKSIDTKITKQTDRLDAIAVTDGQGEFRKLVAKAGTVDQFSEKAATQLQSLTDLLTQRDAMKAAIIQSNAVTTITVGSKTVTVAQAIEQKRSVVLRQALLAKIKSQVNLGNALLTKRTAEFEVGLSVKLDTLLGRDRATKGEDVEGITKPLRERGEPSLLDPVGLAAYADTLETEIDDFLTEVDFALSESNARTEIEIGA